MKLPSRFLTLLAIPALWAAPAGIAAAQVPLPKLTAHTEHEEQEPPTKAELPSAERIAALYAEIKRDRETLEKMNSREPKVESAVQEASKEYLELDNQVKEKQKAADAAKEDAEKKKLEEEIRKLEENRAVAKKQFELTLQERLILRRQVATLEARLEQNRRTLDRLTGAAPEEPPPAAKGLNGKETPPQKNGKPPEPEPKEVSKARETAAVKDAQARQAEAESRSLEERMAALDSEIQIVQQLLETLKEKGKLAEETRDHAEAELKKLQDAGAPAQELEAVRTRLAEARRKAAETREDLQAKSRQLEFLRSRKTLLASEQQLAQREADFKKREAERAKKELENLENPFAPRNLLRWFVARGPRILVILAAFFLLRRLIRVLDQRMVNWLSRNGNAGDSQEERENRARTLVDVFHNAAMITIVMVGTIMFLEAIGVPIVPLMGGAAVIGLAVAFGAQNLVKDYFTGFMILVENQYGVNDVVQIGQHGGMVERITLRMTVLRDLDGTAHFLPHGQVGVVSNRTHGWSRALFDIGVAYKEDVDRVIQVLKDLGREMRRDPVLGNLILEDVEMLGVDAFGDSAVTIKFFIKTKPLKQWQVKREMLRRIKIRFDELGIEIPFPHRTLYVRGQEEGEGDAGLLTGPAAEWPPRRKAN